MGYDTEQPRLLPWTADGRPCYLRGDGDGVVARFADDVEELQLDTGAEVLGQARAVLGDAGAQPVEVRNTALRLVECLTDALRVAVSRGARIPGGPCGR